MSYPGPKPRTAAERPFLERTRRKVRALDLALLFAIPALLVLVYALPEAFRDEFVLYYLEPTLLTAFASHFVHLEATHLLANLLGYGLLAGVGYLLAVHGNCRRFFLSALLVIVLVFPLVLSGLNLAVPRNAVSYGFSGVNMALLGLLPLVLGEYLRATFTPTLERRHVGLAYFVATAIIALIAVPIALSTVALATTSVGIAGLYAHGLLQRHWQLRRLGREILERPGYGELALAGGVVFVSYLFVAFPADVVYGTAVLNIYVHFLGYSLGFIGPYLVLEAGTYDRPTSPLKPPSSPRA